MLNNLLGGRYRIIQALGEGGLAQTFLAEDQNRPGRPKCAVKVLKPSRDNSNFLSTSRRLFQKEAEILEKLGEHKQIPRLLAYFEDYQNFYIVQDFIEGHTLSTELPHSHRWSESKVISMLRDVLSILVFVHSYGVIHRDIKPNNLIRRQKDGRLVLIDFGAVKEVRNPRNTHNAPPTKKTISIGTQGYIPTEQARGKPRLNSDIYALGMVGIQALTGIDPVYLQEDGEGEVIWQDRGDFSEQLAIILSNMVRYHFKDRYQSAQEVLTALDSIANQSSSSTISATTQKVLATPSTSESSDLVEFQATNQQSDEKVVSESRISKLKGSSNVINTEDSENLKVNNQVESREDDIALDINQQDLELLSNNELKETKLSEKIEQTAEESVFQPELKETTISLADENISSPANSRTESRETKSFLTENDWLSWNSSVNQDEIYQPNLETKEIAQDLDNSLEKDTYPELKETKISLEITQNNSNLIQQPDIKETKVSVSGNDQKIRIKRILQTELEKATIALNSINIKEKLDSVFLTTESALVIIKNIDLRNYNLEDVRVFFQKYRLLTGAGVSLILLGIIAGYAYVNQKQSYLKAKNAWINIEELKKSKKFHQCIQNANDFANNYANFHAEVEALINPCQEGLAQEQLLSAKKLAEESKYKDAIALLAQIPQDAKVNPEATRLMAQWLEKIWQLANNKYQEGDLEQAKAIITAIPSKSIQAKKIETKIQQWEKNWQANQNHLKTAQSELNNQRWQAAIDEAKKVKNNEFWQKKRDSIIQEAETEIAAARRELNSSYSSTSTNNSTNSYPKYNSTSNSTSTTESSSPISSPEDISSPLTAPEPIRSTGGIVCSNKNSPIPRCRNLNR